MIADLTGIPDFFSQITPFLRSIIPGRRWQGSRLPPLRRRVKAVFSTYIVITIPVLAVLLALLVSNLPKLVITAWDALLYQQVESTIAWMDGNVPMMVAIVVQALFLLLQFVGIGLILYSAAHGPVTVTRNALRARRWRLAGAMLGATAAVLLALAFVWMHQLGASAAAPPPGVEPFSIPERTYVDVPVRIDRSPPVAGNHAPVW